MKVTGIVLDRFPISRQSYIEILKNLFLENPFEFEEHLFTEIGCKVIDELHYLFDSAPIYRHQILNLHEMFLSQFGFNGIVALLNHKIYEILASGIQLPDN